MCKYKAEYPYDCTGFCPEKWLLRLWKVEQFVIVVVVSFWVFLFLFFLLCLLFKDGAVACREAGDELELKEGKPFPSAVSACLRAFVKGKEDGRLSLEIGYMDSLLI